MPNQLNGIWAGEKGQVWLAIEDNKDNLSSKESNLETNVRLWTKAKGEKLAPFHLIQDDVPIKIQTKLGPFFHRNQKGYWFVRIGEALQMFDENGNFLYNFNPNFGEGTFLSFIDFFEDDTHFWLPTSIGLFRLTHIENPFQLVYGREGFSDSRGITEDDSGNIYF